MDTFVIRIYRKGKGSEDPLAGIVEVISTGSRMEFHSLEELADLLGIGGPPVDERGKET